MIFCLVFFENVATPFPPPYSSRGTRHTCPCRLEPSHSQKIFQWVCECLYPHTCTFQSAALLQRVSSVFSDELALLQPPFHVFLSQSLLDQPGIPDPDDALTNSCDHIPIFVSPFQWSHPSSPHHPAVPLLAHPSPYQPGDCRRRTAVRSVSGKGTAQLPPGEWLHCTCPAQR